MTSVHHLLILSVVTVLLLACTCLIFRVGYKKHGHPVYLLGAGVCIGFVSAAGCMIVALWLA